MERAASVDSRHKPLTVHGDGVTPRRRHAPPTTGPERLHEERGFERRQCIYLAPKLLIIGELGNQPLDKLGATQLLQLVAAGFESGSTLLTNNESFGQ